MSDDMASDVVDFIRLPWYVRRLTWQILGVMQWPFEACGIALYDVHPNIIMFLKTSSETDACHVQCLILLHMV